jgi:uncharacterized damage-inducible protein DinB
MQPMRAYFKRLYLYDFWANSLVLDLLTQAPEVTQKSRKLISHVVAAQAIWLARFTDKPFSGGVFDILSFDELRELAQENQEAMQHFIDSFADESFMQPLPYKSIKGDPFSNTMADVLTHVANHGSHHRAQILSDMKPLVDTLPIIDFIAFARLNP